MLLDHSYHLLRVLHRWAALSLSLLLVPVPLRQGLFRSQGHCHFRTAQSSQETVVVECSVLPASAVVPLRMGRQYRPRNCRGLYCSRSSTIIIVAGDLRFESCLRAVASASRGRVGWTLQCHRGDLQSLSQSLPLGWREPRVELPSFVSFSSLWEERLGSSPSSSLLLWKRFGLAAFRLVPDVRIWSPVRCVSAAAVQPAVLAAASVLAGVAAWE